MNIPFTIEQFFSVFGSYNAAVWPMQVITYILGVAAIFMILIRYKYSNQFIAAILSLLWIWNGAVYHIGFFSKINKPAYLFGALFVGQGLLLFWKGVLKKKLQFDPSWNIKTMTGALLILYAMAVYPIFNYLSGHSWAQQPIFGIAPCPTTIFTFGLFLICNSQFPKTLIIIPFLWSLVGMSAAMSLQITADFGLIVAGIIASIMIIIRKRNTSTMTIANPSENII